MDQVELMIFEVFYNTDAGVDYSMFRAEDEDHAVEKFREFYPDEEIITVECRGDAF